MSEIAHLEVLHWAGAPAAALTEPGGDGERQLEALVAVQAGITHRLVPVGKIRLLQLQDAADTLGDVVACQLDVQSARPGAERVMDIEEATHLLDDVIEGPRLVPVGRLKGVAMHRITHPGDFTAGLLHPRDHIRKDLTHIACAHPGNECDPARLPSGVKTISELDGLLWRGGGAQLDAQGVAHPSQQLDVGPVEQP